MNGQKRVIAAIRRESLDRIPLDIWARPEVFDNLTQHFCVSSRDELLDCLGIDIENLFTTFEDPSFCSKTQYRIPGSSSISDALAIDCGDGTYIDQWGVRYGLDPIQSVDHVVEAPFKDASIPSDYIWPSLEGIESVESLETKIKSVHERGKCVFGRILNPFKQAWQLRGFDNFLIDLYLNRNFAKELFERLAIYSESMALNLINAGADVICIVGDVAMQDRMFFDPKIFSQLLAPAYSKIIESACSKRKVPFFFHSDGNILPILGSLADAGFSVVNPIQPESLDPVEAKRLYGERLTLHGLISVQTTLPQGTEEDVRKTVRYYIDHCGTNGGLILCTTNQAMTDIPLNNLIAFYDEARRYSKIVYSN